MKQLTLSRRQFFKLSAFGVSTLATTAVGLASVAAAPSHEALAAAQQPQSPDIPQPTFNPIASNTTFGPLTDISMGWDGTLWGIDGEGAPHIYDPVNNVWAQHGDGIDAAAFASIPGHETVYVFQGPNVVPLDGNTLKASSPTTIAALWPHLPDSFKLGVTGAMTSAFGTGVILFNSGRYISTDGDIPLGKLTDLKGWPQTPTWKDGVIDAAFMVLSVGVQVLVRAGEVLSVRLNEGTVIGSPMSFADFTANFLPPLPADWMTAGVDAWTLTSTSINLIFKGTTVVSYDTQARPLPAPATIRYIGNAFENWPTTFHPVLAHAPNGRDGNLWSVLTSPQGAYTMQHNGESWAQLPYQADHVGVGQDNAVMLASAQKLWRVTVDANNNVTNVSPVSAANNLIQVSLGNANAVFARDSSNNVYSFNPATGALTPNTDVGAAQHIATTNDGSLWHAKPNDPNIHRQLTNAASAVQVIPVKQTLLKEVTRVAGTGFGASHCLATDNQNNTQAYRYDSPYVFMSQNGYIAGTTQAPQITQGLGNLYLYQSVSSITPGQDNTTLIAIDAHTGVEVSRSAESSPHGTLFYTNAVFDPVHELIYVGTWVPYPVDTTTPCKLLALDARDLTRVVWSFNTTASVNAPPALIGNTLIFGDRTGTVYTINTQAAAANPASVTAQTTWTLSQLNANGINGGIPNVPGMPQGGFATFAPAITVEGKYCLSLCVTYYYGPPAPFYALYYYTVILDPATRGTSTYAANALYASPTPRNPLPASSLDFGQWLTQSTPPILANAVTEYSNGTRVPCVFFACDGGVVRQEVTSTNPTTPFVNLPRAFVLPTGSNVFSGLAWDATNEAIWFGDQNGTLYGLNGKFEPLAHTPVLIAPKAAMTATPLPYTDPKGNTSIFVGVGEDDSFGFLYYFDPASGSTTSVETGVTQITTLSASISHGVIYVAGEFASQAEAGGNPQVLGIRVDTLTQGARDFIIESQLMQDPDQNATGSGNIPADPKAPQPDNPIPPSVARYQTHLSIVDDQKNPLPKEAVKIWADLENTVITVNGQQFTIGPTDSAYANVVTGIDGSLVIVSDANDINTSALRVWAPFMNPYERIAVFPDHEWHGRSANSYSDPNADPTQAPDPTKPNLNTVHTYRNDPATNAPKQLFTGDEKTQGTPTNVANAVSQMNSGLNPGGNTPASVAGALKTLHGSNPDAPYVAYTTLGGMHYGPTNARIKRTAAVAAPFGFALTKPKGGTHTFKPLSHSDARDAIDALTGTAWDPNKPNDPLPSAHATSDTPGTFVIRRTNNIFTDFWNWLKGAFNTLVQAIESIVVSVAEDIVVGINFIINGVEKVFKAVIQIIDDVCNAIGSFFMQLVKLIEEVIEALSVLFHFGEIMWTHRWLAGQVNQRVADLTTAITSTIVPNIDTFFKQGETAIAGFFDSLKAEFSTSGNPQLSNTRGYGQSPHTAFTITPKGGTPSSQAPQCTWGTQKAQSGTPGAAVTNPTRQTSTQDAAQAAAPYATTGDPVSDFIDGFVASLSTDPVLSQAMNQLKSDFGNLVQVNSASQFFSQLMVTLLDLIKTLMISALAVANALIDGLAKIIQDVINAVLNILNAEIEIPVLTWLYETLFGEKLTLLNIVTLVSAIPITLIFRLVQGQYPSQANLPSSVTAAVSSAKQVNGVEAAPTPALMAFGIFVGICQLVQGAANGVGDSFGSGNSPTAAGYVSLACGTLIEIFSFPLIGSAPGDVSEWDWAVYGIGVFEVIFLVAGLPYTGADGKPNEPASTEFMSFGSLVLSLGLFAVAITAYVKDGKTDGISNAEFAETIIESIIGALNPIKLSGGESAVVVAAFDILGGIVEMFMSLFTAIISNASAEPPRKYYFPWIALNAPPVPALVAGSATR